MTRATGKKKSVRLPAFAKINLCLHVLGKRPDGYHELRTIFQAISLRDTLELSFTPGSSGFDFALTSNDAALLGPQNLVARALTAMQQEIGFHGYVTAHLEKKIPVARGMGGGSSDAAAAMIGTLRLTGRKVPLARLMEIAAGLGADVPFFLFGGRALAVNRGAEVLACLLTGMGRDGAAGLLAIRRAGGFTIAQDESTSVIYGMPREAVLLGAAQMVLPLDQIGPRIAEILGDCERHTA